MLRPEDGSARGDDEHAAVWVGEGGVEGEVLGQPHTQGVSDVGRYLVPRAVRVAGVVERNHTR